MGTQGFSQEGGHLALQSVPPLQRAGFSLSLVRLYQYSLFLLFALSPLLLIFYLELYQDPAIHFHSHLFHELAIGLAILLGFGITFICWRCYRESGEVLLRWLALAFLAFTLVYAPHGIFTRLAADNPPLFLLYGPASRMVMAVFVFVGLLQQSLGQDAPERRRKVLSWWPWLLLIIGLDVLVAILALNPAVPHAQLRVLLESSALILNLAALISLLAQRSTSPLMWFFAFGICFFAQSSLSFFLAAPWNHQWWLAHAIFAAGFLLLSFGVVRAYLSTGRLVAVFSAEQWMAEVLHANARAQAAIAQLHESNQRLEEMAHSDPLTGIPNRRCFMKQAAVMIDEADTQAQSLSLMLIDLDHFKQINDRFGHDVGDQVLKRFSDMLATQLRHRHSEPEPRPRDFVARIGGEEFAALLPQTSIDQATFAAERLRAACSNLDLGVSLGQALTVSIGLATYPCDGDEVKALLKSADKRLYAAKVAGRDKVYAA